MIETVTIHNFKAIRSATVKLNDFTVFIGNNGSGKSSVIEALQTLQNVLLFGISDGFTERWFGLEHIRHASKTGEHENNDTSTQDIELEIHGTIGQDSYNYALSFNATANGHFYLVTSERLQKNTTDVFHAHVIEPGGKAELLIGASQHVIQYQANCLVLSDKHLHDNHEFAFRMARYIASWQFLTLEPERMYFPIRRDYGQSQVRLKSSGENIADFFSRLQDDAFQNELILEKMRYILPELAYIGREEITIQKQIYLFLEEQNHDKRLPSWLFSSGTLRVLALLSILNNVNRPPVIFIEEIENGLDPRALNLIVEEIRGILPEQQCIVTTHSPYFLDLAALRHVVVAERQDGKTSFYRPDDDERLKAWKEKFSAGKLYTMDKLTRV